MTSVRVICRFRPLNEKEKSIGGSSEKFKFSSTNDTIEVDGKDGGKRIFSFDHIYHGKISQKDVYEEAARKTIDDVLMGYNGTIFAYGQTGSGKTFTMFGPHLDSSEDRGIIPRTCSHLFEHIEKFMSTIKFEMQCSFLEIYKETVRDLLNPINENLKVRETPSKGVWVEGLTEFFVSCENDILQLIQVGEQFRSVSSTEMNSQSSRSHSLFIISLKQTLPDGSTKTGKLNLADLAGSEKISKTGAKGETLEEAKKINLSLSALGNCIAALSKQKKGGFVPYRDSKLTHILKESLGGNSKTTLLINASPSEYNYDETLSTLRFGERAKKIKCNAKANVKRSVEELTALVKNLQLQLRRLKKYSDMLEEELKNERGPSWDVGEIRNRASVRFSILPGGKKDPRKKDSSTPISTRRSQKSHSKGEMITASPSETQQSQNTNRKSFIGHRRRLPENLSDEVNSSNISESKSGGEDDKYSDNNEKSTTLAPPLIPVRIDQTVEIEIVKKENDKENDKEKEDDKYADEEYNPLDAAELALQLQKIIEVHELLKEEMKELVIRERDQAITLIETKEKLEQKEEEYNEFKCKQDAKTNERESEKNETNYKLSQVVQQFKQESELLLQAKNDNIQLKKVLEETQGKLLKLSKEKEEITLEFARMELQYKSMVSPLQTEVTKLQKECKKRKEESDNIQKLNEDLKQQNKEQCEHIEILRVQFEETMVSNEKLVCEKVVMEKKLSDQEYMHTTLVEKQNNSICSLKDEVKRMVALQEESSRIRSKEVERSLSVTSEIQSLLEQQKGEISEEKERVLLLEAELAKKDINIENKKKKIQSLIEKLIYADEKNETLSNTLEKAQEQASNSIELLEEKTTSLQKRLEKYLEDKLYAEAELSTASIALIAKTTEIEHLQSKVTEIKSKLERGDKELSQMELLSAEMDHLNEVNEPHRNKLEKTESLRVDALKELEIIKCDYSANKSALQSVSEDFKFSQQKVIELNNVLVETSKQNSELERQYKELNEKMQIKVSKYQQTKNESAEAHITIKQLQKEKELIQRDIVNIKSENEGLQKQLMEFKEKIETQNSRSNNVERRMTVSLQQNMTVLVSLEEMRSQLAKEKSRSSEIQAKKLNLEADLSRAIIERQKSESQVLQIRKELELSTNSINELNAELMQKKAKLEEFEESDAEVRVRRIREELHEQKEAHLYLEEKYLKFQQTLLDQQQECNKHNMELEKTISSFIEVTTRLKNSKKILGVTQKRVTSLQEEVYKLRTQLKYKQSGFEEERDSYRASINKLLEKVETLKQMDELRTKSQTGMMVRPVRGSHGIRASVLSLLSRKSQSNLRSNSFEKTIEREGYLWKQGRVVKNWKRRWFVLKKGYLYYYDSNESDKLRGQILLWRCFISDASLLTNKPHTFSIQHDASRIYYLQAANSKEMSDWMTAIKTSVGRWV